MVSAPHTACQAIELDGDAAHWDLPTYDDVSLKNASCCPLGASLRQYTAPVAGSSAAICGWEPARKVDRGWRKTNRAPPRTLDAPMSGEPSNFTRHTSVPSL